MKLFYSTICLATFLLSSVISFGQGTVDVISGDQIQGSLFAKGTSVIDLIPNVSYSSMNNNNNNDISIRTNNFNTNLRGNYYLADNIAIVAGIHGNNQTTKTDNYSTKEKLFLFEMGGQYGKYFGDFPISAELTFGLGSYSNYDGLIDTESKAFAFSYNINIATYVELENSNTYVKPFIGYGGLSKNYNESDFKQNESGLFLGATLVKPMACPEYYCGCGDDVLPDRYDKGSNYLQFTQKGLLGIGTRTYKSNGSTFKDNLFGYTVRLADYHYVADNLAVGAGLEVTGHSESSKENDYKRSTFDLYAMPMVRYNVPVDGPLNNLFADGGLILGTMSETVTDIFNEETKTKSNTFGWELGVGYNYPFSDHFSATGIGYYEDKSNKDVDTDVKTKDTGYKFLLGMSYRF